jgi:hypothetical protein
MRTSIEKMVDNMERLYENIYNLLGAFKDATTTSNSNVTTTQRNPDGTTSTVTVNSFQNILQELTRIDSNFKSLLNEDNISYVLNSDGSMSQVTRTSFMNAEYLSNFTYDGNSCVVDKVSLINDLVYPMVKLPVTVDSKLSSGIICEVYDIKTGWDTLSASPTQLEIEYLASTGKLTYVNTRRELNTTRQQVKYFGKFNIESLTVSKTSNNVYSLILDKLTYSGLYINGSSVSLKDGDFLVTTTGASKWQVTSVDKVSRTVSVTRVSGSETLNVGIDKLCFNEVLDAVSDTTSIVNVPVFPTQQVVVFLSTESLKSISYPSTGIKLDTSTYKVIQDNVSYTLDEFFSSYVTNYSSYLSSLIFETSIPASLGVIPDKVVLKASNFKVVQINKHVTDSKVNTDIEQLNKQKQKVQDDVDFTQKQINTYNSDVAKGNYKNATEKEYKRSQVQTLTAKLNSLKTNLLSVSREIDSNATKSGLKNTTPKYRVIGYWPVAKPKTSTLTQKQNIIKYDVQARYLAKDIDTVDALSYKMEDDEGNDVTVTVSPWSDIPTRTLNKVMNSNGTLTWETNILDSSEDVNINNCSISINENESMEIRVRAVSEAGMPLAPLKGQWSEPLRVDFPNNLRTNNLSYSVEQNTSDLQKAEFNALLRELGLDKHVSGAFIENEREFDHIASRIASGQFTSERKNIPLDECIKNIISRLTTVENKDSKARVNVELVDFNNETFSVTNNTTIELFAGNYVDVAPVSTTSKWGTIVRKQCYIKVRNNNSTPVEVRSLVPGADFDSTNAPLYYNVPVSNVSSSTFRQQSRLVTYFRNVDLTGQQGDAYRLVIPATTLESVTPVDINNSAVNKNLVYIDVVNNVEIKKLGALNPQYTTNFIAYTTEHPLYNPSLLNSVSDPMTLEFNRLRAYTPVLKAPTVQNEVDINTLYAVCGFDDNDFYSVGKTTCGAFLYPVLQNIGKLVVSGNTTTSVLVVPANSELLIPVVYEYRMTDRLGNINGEFGYDTTQSLEYGKKIGIDLLVDNDLFRFDLKVYSRLKSKVNVKDSLNISSVTSSFTQG